MCHYWAPSIEAVEEMKKNGEKNVALWVHHCVACPDCGNAIKTTDEALDYEKNTLQRKNITKEDIHRYCVHVNEEDEMELKAFFFKYKLMGYEVETEGWHRNE